MFFFKRTPTHVPSFVDNISEYIQFKRYPSPFLVFDPSPPPPPPSSPPAPLHRTQGYLYKRRERLRGRFAYRRRHAMLLFPCGPATDNTAGFDERTTRPQAPTLVLLKGAGLMESEKTITLEVRGEGEGSSGCAEAG